MKTTRLLAIFILSILFTSGCTVIPTSYEGFITYPPNIIFDNANFKYIKTITGSSFAVFDGLNGQDIMGPSNGLISSAKSDMYKRHIFKPNQIITNISRDVIKTYINYKHEVKVVMSADVYEFSNNGIYSIDDSSNFFNQYGLTDNDVLGFTEGNIKDYNPDDNLIILIGEKLYKGSVAKKTSNTTVKITNVSELINGDWVLVDISKVKTIPISYVIYYKLMTE
tara:strand:+ start:13 stop:684 length:672 start_codon:yes stop_codon:yes gene_type:complete